MFGNLKCELLNHKQQQVIGVCENRFCQQIYRKVCLDCINLHQSEDNFDTNDIKTEEMLEEIICHYIFRNQQINSNNLLHCQIQKYILNLELLELIQYWSKSQKQLDDIENQIKEFNINFLNQNTLKSYLDSDSKKGIYDFLGQREEKLIEIEKQKNQYLSDIQIGYCQMQESQIIENINPFVSNFIDYLNEQNNTLIQSLEKNEKVKGQQNSLHDSIYELLSQEANILNLSKLKEQAKKYFPSKIEPIIQNEKTFPGNEIVQFEELQLNSESCVQQIDLKNDAQKEGQYQNNIPPEDEQQSAIQHQIFGIQLSESSIYAQEEEIKIEQFLSLGRQLVQINNYSAGIHMFDQVLKLSPQHNNALVEKGCALKKLKQQQEAQDYYQKGISLQCINNDSEALNFCEKALKLDPLNKCYQENKADILEKLEKYSEAIICYEELIKQDPLKSQYYGKKSKIEYQCLKIDSCIESLNEAIKLDPENADFYNDLGLAYNEKKQFNQAIAMIDKAIELNYNNFLYHLNKGIILYENDKFEEAQDALDFAIEIDINSAEAYFYKGLTYNSQCEYYEALEMFDQAISIDPDDAEFYYEKALLLVELKDYQAAKQAFNEAIRINPDNDEVYNSKGLMFQQMQNHNAAIQMFDKAISLNESEPIYYFNKGMLYYELDSFEKAVKMFNKAINLDPNDYQYCFNKAICLYELGKYKHSKRLFKQLLNSVIRIDAEEWIEKCNYHIY